MDSKLLSAADIGKLADLESREVLLSKAGRCDERISAGAVSLFAAPLSQTARVVEALRARWRWRGRGPAAKPRGRSQKPRGRSRSPRDRSGSPRRRSRSPAAGPEATTEVE